MTRLHFVYFIVQGDSAKPGGKPSAAVSIFRKLLLVFLFNALSCTESIVVVGMEGLVEIVVCMLQAQKKKPDTKAKKPGGKEEFTEQILSVCMRKAEHRTCAVPNFPVLVV